MRLSLRFVIPLALALAAIAYAVVPLVDGLMLRWSVRDIDMRSKLVASAIHESIQESLASGSKARTLRVFDKIIEDERLYALGFCSASGGPPIATNTFPDEISCEDLDRFAVPSKKVLRSDKGPLHVAVVGIEASGTRLGDLVLVHDMSFVQRRSEETKRYVFFFFIGLGAIVSLITVAIAQLSWRGWIEGVRALMRGEGLLRPSGTAPPATLPELRPIASDLRELIRDIESEHRARDESQMTWSPDTLRTILRNDLRGEDVLVVSNREPYIHSRRDGRIEISRPASGLVTALEPVVRACSGTWIAHGGGTADRDVVDAGDHIMVPPGNPSYNLRRVWLTEEEESGYYYGFSNEGLWPLCHIAHVRPTFRTADWKQYVEVESKIRRRRRAGGQDGGSHRPGAGLPFRPAAADDPRQVARTPPSSPSGTFRGRTRKRSRSAPGARNCSTASWAAASSGSTPGSIATTSSTPWTGRWRPASTGRRSR